MASRPLLLFPRPVQVSRNKGRSYQPKVHFPSPERQRERLAPIFRELGAAFEKRRIALQQSAAGAQPEQVLVLELIGGVDDFAKALRGIDGLEWLGEVAVEDLVPDEDFFNVSDPEAQLKGRLYLIWQNQEGLQQLLSLKQIYDASPMAPEFQRGRARFAALFRQVRTIRLWGPEDRLPEPDLRELWRYAAQAGKPRFRVEVELWARSRASARANAARKVKSLIAEAGGAILSEVERVEDLAYHALLADMPTQMLERLFDADGSELVRCDGVMFFRPTAQSAFPIQAEEALEIQVLPTEPVSASALGEPVVALLDGLPLAGHELLANRLRIDDPEGWENEYPVQDRQHGTAMASLILHGDLGTREPPLARQLYVRPVLRPFDGWSKREERMPEDQLTLDLIERAVLRIVRGTEAQPAVAPTVRVISLSLGDPARPYDRFPSPWARLLDFLAVKHNLLFVVSAGNHTEPLSLRLSPREYRELARNPDKLRREVLQAVLQAPPSRRLLSPAESINSLTTGGLNTDGGPALSAHPDLIDLLGRSELPALYNSFGPGFNRAVKPEILLPGGRLFFREMPAGSDRTSLHPVDQGGAPGQAVASPGPPGGGLSRTRFERGTSNSAALAARLASRLYDLLLELKADEETSTEGRLNSTLALTEKDFPVLIKTLLVHGSSWGASREALELALGKLDRKGSPLSRMLGFGAVDPARVLECTAQRVTLLGWGEVGADSGYHFRLPLPQSLSGKPVFRRLVATLAWFSPINPRHHRYRRAALDLDLYSDSQPEGSPAQRRQVLGMKPHEVVADQARRGAVVHEVWEGKHAIPYSDDQELNLQVSCRKDAGELRDLVRYGLAVTLEVEGSTGLPIYEEVAERIRLAQRARIRPPLLG